MSGQELTLWTARAAAACYFVRIVFDLSAMERQRDNNVARWAWTAGLAIYLAHVVCAFHFYHDWSHQAAWDHTARVSREKVGLDWGGGLYFNYAFTAIWIADVIGWWTVENYQQRSRVRFWGVHFVFAFMMINATVVFGPSGWRAVGAVALGIFLLLVWRRLRRRPSQFHSDT